ncbi:UNVERIFIED_CONTAM: hypothetical protein K2H54_021363 [Gekko kuhli]
MVSMSVSRSRGLGTLPTHPGHPPDARLTRRVPEADKASARLGAEDRMTWPAPREQPLANHRLSPRSAALQPSLDMKSSTLRSCTEAAQKLHRGASIATTEGLMTDAQPQGTPHASSRAYHTLDAGIASKLFTEGGAGGQVMRLVLGAGREIKEGESRGAGEEEGHVKVSADRESANGNTSHDGRGTHEEKSTSSPAHLRPQCFRCLQHPSSQGRQPCLRRMRHDHGRAAPGVQGELDTVVIFTFSHTL